MPADTPSATSARRPYLVVTRVGDSSLHPTWTDGPRNFDLVVDYYGSTPGRWAGTADVVVESKGSKWRGLHALLRANPHFLTDYDAVWFPDDDIATDAATVSALFDLHAELGLGLSQPSLTTDSYFTHLMTLRHPGFRVRLTNFVEVMVPVFSRQALQACWATFDDSESGYGLDLVWQGILPGLGLQSAILDCLSVRHTRPLGGGTLYDTMKEPPHREGARVARQHGMPTPHTFATLGAVDVVGNVLSAATAELAVAQDPPRPTVQEVPAWDLYLGEVRERVAAGRAGQALAAPEPPPQVARGAWAQPTDAAPAELSSLDPDLPLALVAGDDALDRLLSWRAAGWQTALLPSGHLEYLAEQLAGAESFAVRALDVEERDSRALERAVTLARSTGATVVVRATPAVLVCEHQVPEHVRRAMGGCQSCLVEWRSIAAASSVVVAGGAAAQWLEPLVETPTALVAELDPSVLGVGVPAESPTTTTVVVFDRGIADDRERLLAALDAQRGVPGPVEVLLVRSGSRVPTPRAAADRGGVRVRTIDGAGPVGFAGAVAAASGDRVLVLDSTDVPGPWCLFAHADAAARTGAAAAVVSAARADLLGTDDPFTEVLHSLPHSSSRRVSAPTAQVAATARVHAVATAATAVAVLAAGQVLTSPEAPTHSTLAFTDLSAERRSAVLTALAAGTVDAPEETDVARWRPELTYWSQRGTLLAGLGHDLLPLTGETLRGVVLNPVRGDRGVEGVREVLGTDLGAHWAAGTLAVARARASASAGRPLVLAVEADDARLAPLLLQLAASAVVDREGLQILVRLAPDADGRAFAERLSAALTAAGVGFDQLPDIQVATDEAPAGTRRDADVALHTAGEPWFPGYPVPLLELDPHSWLAYLAVAALVAQPARAAGHTQAIQSAPPAQAIQPAPPTQAIQPALPTQATSPDRRSTPC